MKLVAVITGDVVGSSAVNDTAFLNKALKEAFDEIKSRKAYGMLRSFEIYRGDSFQGVLDPQVRRDHSHVLVLKGQETESMNAPEHSNAAGQPATNN